MILREYSRVPLVDTVRDTFRTIPDLTIIMITPKALTLTTINTVILISVRVIMDSHGNRRILVNIFGWIGIKVEELISLNYYMDKVVKVIEITIKILLTVHIITS